MKEKLKTLYNTLSMIETKGNNTKLMAQCLMFVEQMYNEQDKPEEPIVTETEE